MPGPWFWIWAFLAAGLMIAEMFTAGFFLLPFGIGAAAAAALEFVGVEPGWQWAAFLVLSTTSFLLLRRLADRITHDQPIGTGADRLVGKTGLVTEELVPDNVHGRVRIEREEWRADAPGFGNLGIGTRVVVDAIEGTHLIVHPEE